MNAPTNYSIAAYGGMIADTVRMDAYKAALERAVKPGCVVLDIGAGTGIFSLLACRLGARRVFAVEPDDAILVARQVAADNGYADRITFIQALSTRVTLPEPADVIVSDLRGVLPLFQHHIAAIADARQRHLAPGGALIPRRDTLWAAVVETPPGPDAMAHLPEARPYGFDMTAARRMAGNLWWRVSVKDATSALLAEPQRAGTLDYLTLAEPDFGAELTWPIRRAGSACGLLLWFDAELADGIGFSNAPGQPPLIYSQAFFPLAEPVAVEAGDFVATRLTANLAGDDYVWRWETTVTRAGAPESIKAKYDQSTFYGRPLAAGQLRKRAAGYLPRLTEDGAIERATLNLMDGCTSLEEIARLLFERFPGRFASRHDALTHAGDLAQKHSR
jgi:protein arginine N-methyltransferase 1